MLSAYPGDEQTCSLLVLLRLRLTFVNVDTTAPAMCEATT